MISCDLECSEGFEMNDPMSQLSGLAPPPAQPPAKPAVIAVSSQVARGGVGTRALSFALERLGHSVWLVPTVFLPWHTGHGPSTRIQPPEDRFEAALNDLVRLDSLKEVGAIVTGFLGSHAQATAIARFVARAKAAKPDILFVCDPVIGDVGGLYVSRETAEAVRDVLLPMADAATPNVWELGWLTGKPVETTAEVLAAARALGPERVLATSAPAMMRNSIATMLVSREGALMAEHPAFSEAPSGTGDLIAALFTAGLLSGASAEAVLVRATASTYEVVARSVKAGADELLFVAEQESLVRPAANIHVRRLAEVSGRRAPSPVIR